MPWVDRFSSNSDFPISYSKLKTACTETWAQFKYAIDNPEPVGAGAQFSRLFHQVLFEQSTDTPVEEPDLNLRTKDGKETFSLWASELPRGATVLAKYHSVDWLIERINRPDITIFKGGDFAKAQAMADSLRARPFWRENYPLGIAETKGEAELEGCTVRFVPDLRIPEKRLLVDAKGVADISEDGIIRSVFKFAWDIQAALYLQAATKVDEIPYDRFILALVHSEEPYIAVEREIPADVLQFAWDVARVKLREYRTCMILDSWPGYPEEVKTLDWKPWMVAAREAMINV